MNGLVNQQSSFTLKMKPVTDMPVLKDDTPETIFEAWKTDRNPEMGAKLLHSLQPSIDHAVRKWTGDANPVAVGQARSLLIDALPRYDPSKAQLATFVDRQLQPLQRWKSRKNLGVKVQTGMVQELSQLKRVQAELDDELGRAPSYEEIADRSGIPMQRIQKLRKMRHPGIAEAATVDSDGNEMFAEDQSVEDQTQLWHKTVYHSLNSVDQVVMQHTVGLYGADVLPNQQLAKKLRISPGAVSQRKLKIQKLLDSQDNQF